MKITDFFIKGGGLYGLLKIVSKSIDKTYFLSD